MREFTIKLPDGIIISSKLKEEDISSIRESKNRDMNNGYVWYYLPVVELHNENIVLSLCFYNGVIDSLTISIFNPELYGHDWNDWSEKKEKACAKDTENWLTSIGYETGKYSWGEIWAGYDSKGGSGSAGVRYVL